MLQSQSKRNLSVRLCTLVLIGWCSIWSTQVLSQNWINDYGFEKYYGDVSEDQGQAIIQTADRGFLAIGWGEDPVINGGDNDIDVLAIRIDVDGSLIWQKYIDKGFIELGFEVVELSDGSFVIAGERRAAPADDFEAFLMKIDGDGNEIWFQTYDQSGITRAKSLIATDDGFLIAGTIDEGNSTGVDILLIKTDQDGNEIWSNTYTNADNVLVSGVTASDNAYYIVGSATNPNNLTSDAFVLKTDLGGSLQWKNFYGTTDYDEGTDIILTQDGQLAITGNFESISDVALLKIDTDGNVIWETTFGNGLSDQGFALVQNPVGEYVVTGISEVSASNIDILLANISEDGQTINWLNQLGRSSHVDWAQDVTTTLDGGYAIVGYNAQNALFFNDITIIKTQSGGNIFSNKLEGKVFIDNENCNLDPGEQGLENWIVEARSNDLTFFGNTDADGNYSIEIDTGTYEVSVFVQNEYWTPCVDFYDVTFTTDYDTLTRNFPMNADVECPWLEVNVSTAVVQNCSNIGYQITWCNQGTIATDTALLEVVLDNNLTLTNATLPLAQQVDSLLIFELDAIAIGECDTLNIAVSSNCDQPEGISYQVSAQIFPDSLCLPIDPDWDESSIKVNGFCDADSVRFELQNDGDGDMNDPQNFIIIEDIIMALEAPYQLASQETQSLSFPANGSTWRIIAEQSESHPGNPYPTVAVEGCSTGGDISTGNVTVFQEDENDLTLSVDIQESTQLNTNLLLRGYPKGYPKNGQQLIPANTSIDYHIAFRNDGIDTVQRLVIRDTISQTLDISSIQPSTGSHVYDFDVYENGILKFTFMEMNLAPDEIGYVTFKIRQQPDLPEGTPIPNNVEMTMGYRAPEVSNTKLYHVGGADYRSFIITEVSEVKVPDLDVTVYPNPFTDQVIVAVEGKHYETLILKIFDASGRQIVEESDSGQQIKYTNTGLPSGMYFFQLYGNDQWIATGKMTVK